jgi:nucleoside-diphosphate-sugar epimerase
MRMKVMITGGSGFIGAWIMRRLLARGVSVCVLDTRCNDALARTVIGPSADAIEWIEGDVGDRAAVSNAAAGCDLIIHLAAILTPECQADPIRGTHINYIGTLNVFEAAIALGHKKVLYMSSASVYGPDDGDFPAPTTQYGVFKLAGEGSARCYYEDHGIASIGFRPLVVYGPGRETGLSAGPTLACRAAARSESFVIPLSGETDFVYVEDVADVFDAACEADIDGAHVWNIPGEVAPMQQFVAEIEKIVPNCDVTIEGPLVPVAARRVLSPPLAGMPVHEVTDLATGIARTVEWYRS